LAPRANLGDESAEAGKLLRAGPDFPQGTRAEETDHAETPLDFLAPLVEFPSLPAVFTTDQAGLYSRP
jgi:hypothetical protein